MAEKEMYEPPALSRMGEFRRVTRTAVIGNNELIGPLHLLVAPDENTC